MSLELVYLEYPKCNRILKPSIEPGILHITEYPKKVVKKIDLHDILMCRYCNVFVKIETLRKQKDPLKFLQQFKRLPDNNEIKDEELHKISLREQESYCLKKYKHFSSPSKCPDCGSEDIIADSHDYGWICMSCDSYFQWEKYLIMFHGDIEVYARDQDEAIEKGYEALRKDRVDIEADWM